VEAISRVGLSGPGQSDRNCRRGAETEGGETGALKDAGAGWNLEECRTPGYTRPGHNQENQGAEQQVDRNLQRSKGGGVDDIGRRFQQCGQFIFGEKLC